MNKFSNVLIGFGLVGSILFTGCAKEKLLLKTYSPPKKQEQVKKMIASSDSASGFINIEIVEDLEYILNGISKNSASSSVANGLILNVKKFINQTNFISLNQVEGEASVALEMQIKTLKYEENENSLSAYVKVNFIIRDIERGELYSELYVYDTKRQSRSGRQGLPSKEEILDAASEYLAKKLIKDLSPIKTRKLVELMGLPDELAYTANYAKRGNFSGAVKAMQNYKGEKDIAFFFNLGVYYEGYASKEDDMALFVKADENYEKAMAMGGSEDETIVKGKLKFDNFYKIIKQVAEQREANKNQSDGSQNSIL